VSPNSAQAAAIEVLRKWYAWYFEEGKDRKRNSNSKYRLQKL